ncbi:MAG: hypothetical protein LJE74_06940 [Proteobacteria bacterium]|jgi:uncharacterized protein|nr:hypothetical protein [Pseudomonadota bacterium]
MSSGPYDRLYSLPAFLLAGCLLLLQGCASYSHSFEPIDAKLANNDPASALTLLDEQGYNDRNQLLYLLNKAMLLRMQGEYAASNQAFEAAKKIIQAYSAISVTEQSTSFVINDTTITYTGIPLDRVMLHTYEALNYLELGDLNNARVEALQVDVLLQRLTQDAPDSALSVDPFARYLAGMIYEELGEDSDAMIAYRKAYEAYKEHARLYATTVPDYLKLDLLRLSRRMGLHEEYRNLKKEFGASATHQADTSAHNGRVVLFFSNGLAPVKRESSHTIIDPGSGIAVRISLPYYKNRPVPVAKVRLRVNEIQSESEQVENVTGIARATLQAAMPGITTRATVRAVTKYQMARQAQRQDDLTGLLVNIMNVVTERADTRSWLTLPANIQMARISLPAGSYTLNIELLGQHGAVVDTRQLKDIRVEASKTRYISYHHTAH